jgi:branched-chain amino acid transport system ATP-binding protein
MLEVEGINVFYGPVQALRDVSLRLDEGEMVALLGANGAGKTSTLRAISGLLSPKHGSIRFEGKEIGGMAPQGVIRLGIAHMPEGRELFAEMTVVENLRLGAWTRRKDRAAVSERLDTMLDLFPRLRERADQQAGTMSGGEQQMLVAARALMSDPKVLLVDELSLGLAPIIVTQLFEAIREVNRRGTAVLLVEQFVHMALQNTARAYVLTKGEVSMSGSSEEFLSSPDLMEAYLGIESDTPKFTPKSEGQALERENHKKQNNSKTARAIVEQIVQTS